MAASGKATLDRRNFLKATAVAGASGLVSSAQGKIPMDTHCEQTWSMKMVAPLEPGIVCQDISTMLAFYTEVLGLKLVSDAEATPEMSARFGAAPKGFKIVRLQTPYGERIKLVQTGMPPEKKNPASQWVFQRHGITYLTFIIGDMTEMLARLNQFRVRLVTQEAIEVRKGFHAIFALDPEQNYLEFVEYQDPASYRPDLFKWRQFF